MTSEEFNALAKQARCAKQNADRFETADKLLTSISEAQGWLQGVITHAFGWELICPKMFPHLCDRNYQSRFADDMKDAVLDTMGVQLKKYIEKWQAEYDAL